MEKITDLDMKCIGCGKNMIFDTMCKEWLCLKCGDSVSQHQADGLCWTYWAVCRANTKGAQNGTSN